MAERRDYGKHKISKRQKVSMDMNERVQTHPRSSSYAPRDILTFQTAENWVGWTADCLAFPKACYWVAMMADCWAFRKATFQCMELVHCVEKRKMKRQTMNIRFVDSDEL
jgi:hypothetical protein